MKDDLTRLQLDLRIDPENLDVDCMEHPNLYMDWAERAVHAKADMEDAKDNLDTVLASCEIEARELPHLYGISKVTDASIKAAVSACKPVRKAKKRYSEARRRYYKLERCDRAMEHRKRMLENMVTLHAHQYFAGPSTTPRNLAEVQHRRKEAREAALYDRQQQAVQSIRRKKTKKRKKKG